MALVKVKPTSPGRRAMVKVVNKDLHTRASLIAPVAREQSRPPAVTTTVTSRRVT
jgi:large subunit ribosomal protein L2